MGHVLGKFAKDERPELEKALDNAVNAVQGALNEGVEAAANVYNTKKTIN